MSGKTIDSARIDTQVSTGPLVPASDSTNNITSRDVIGSKADSAPAPSVAIDSTHSMHAWVKGIWDVVRQKCDVLTSSGPSAPGPDATANSLCRDIIGNKGDAPPAITTAANSTLSVTAYIKALWNLLRSGTLVAGMSTALINGSTASATVANGVNVDLRPGSGARTRFITAAIVSSQSGYSIQFWDGTTSYMAVAGAANVAATFTMTGTNNGCGMRLVNGSGQTATYSYSYAEFLN